MAAGDTLAADPVDHIRTVHYEMDSVVRSDRFYKSV